MHKCDQCPASFLNSEQLSNHRTARHPEEPEILEVTSNSQLQTSNTEKSAHNHQPSVKHKNTLHPHKELIISEVTSNNQQPHFSNTQNLMPSKKIRINFGTGEIQATPVINQATLVKSPTLTVSSQVTLVKKQNPPVNPVQNKTGFVERPFACHKCSESFTSKIVLSLHMQSNHKEECTYIDSLTFVLIVYAKRINFTLYIPKLDAHFIKNIEQPLRILKPINK